MGQIVAITGGARGIGRATARACLRSGLQVAIGDIDADEVARTEAELGDGVLGVPFDVRDPDAFAAFLDQVEDRLGPLDVLVNNAGVAPIGLFVDEDPADTQRLLDINLGAVLTGTRLALQRFLPRGSGHIVNLASSAGQIATAGGATYAATKHGVVGFTRAIRAETRGTGVRTTIVMPGLIRTDMINGFAKGRGVPVDQVRSDMGEGRMLLAEAAVKAGMVDGIRTFADVIAGMRKKGRANSARASALAQAQADIAALS